MKNILSGLIESFVFCHHAFKNSRSNKKIKTQTIFFALLLQNEKYQSKVTKNTYALISLSTYLKINSV